MRLFFAGTVAIFFAGLITAGLRQPAAFAQSISQQDFSQLLEGGPAQMLEQRGLLGGLGIGADQLNRLQQQSEDSGLAKSEMERLCAGIAARHLTADQVKSIGQALGLGESERSELVECARRFSKESPLGLPQNLTEEKKPGENQPSAVESGFRAADVPYKMLQAPELRNLTQFGYELFSEPVVTFAPAANIPVTANYILGPGDELNVILWGRVNSTLHLSVQRDGTILMPQIGPMAVAGLTFDQAKKLIENRAAEINGLNADVTMGRIRSIQVFIIGQVAQPGLYTVSALSHVSDVLSAAGGVRKSGSLRRIEVRRDGHLLSVLDLYSMLLHGVARSDLQLQSRDVIFVPVLGPVAAVAGNVRNPAIYEMRGRQFLSDVLAMAGGVNAFGYAQRVQVERIANHDRRVALDVDLHSAQSRRFALDDGDLVKVFTVLPRQQNVVLAQGNVNRPGSYQWHFGMHVADLIRDSQGIGDHTYLHYAQIKSLQGPARKPHFRAIDLAGALENESGPDNALLHPEDVVTVYSEGETNEIPTVKISGKVRKPGVYPLTGGLTINQLIFEAGGFIESAYRTQAQLAHVQVVDGVTRHINESVRLHDGIDGTSPADLTLKPGDELFVAEAANWHKPWSVTLSGEVMRPGPYPINSGDSLSMVLQRAGGLRADGYLPALILTRSSVKLAQQKNLDQARARLQAEISRAALMPGEGNHGEQENYQGREAVLAEVSSMLTQSEREQATGRIVVNEMSSLQALAGSPADVRLEDADRIIVPRRPNWINVLGQVYGPTAVAYQPGYDARDYVNSAGGLTANADSEGIFVVKVNGEVVSLRSYRDSGENRIFPLLPVVSGGLMSAHLEPGDTIYVPAKLLFVNPIQRTLDITQIVANSAQAIAYAALLGTLL